MGSTQQSQTKDAETESRMTELSPKSHQDSSFKVSVSSFSSHSHQPEAPDLPELCGFGLWGASWWKLPPFFTEEKTKALPNTFLHTTSKISEISLSILSNSLNSYAPNKPSMHMVHRGVGNHRSGPQHMPALTESYHVRAESSWSQELSVLNELSLYPSYQTTNKN